MTFWYFSFTRKVRPRLRPGRGESNCKKEARAACRAATPGSFIELRSDLRVSGQSLRRPGGAMPVQLFRQIFGGADIDHILDHIGEAVGQAGEIAAGGEQHGGAQLSLHRQIAADPHAGDVQ